MQLGAGGRLFCTSVNKTDFEAERELRHFEL